MRLSPQILRFGIVALVSAALELPVLAADDPIVVTLAGGGRARAAMDPRTDGDRLWLTTSLGRGSLSQSIPWEHVREVEIAGRSFEGRVVRAAVATIREGAPRKRPAPTPRHPALPVGEMVGTGNQPRQGEVKTPVARSPARSAPRVQAMTVSARLANWDQDIAFDGIAVELTAYDSRGERIGCDGTVDFTLRTWKTSGRDGRLGMRSESWTETVKAADFVAGSALFRLPLRDVRPQWSSEWWSHGALQARLAAPGSGVVERTVTDLRLRQFEPMRDTLEQRTGRRFFPSESTQRQAWAQSPHSMGGR
jgi:hypothetical protein